MDIELRPWLPDKVKFIIGVGSLNLVGYVDEDKVLKYPLVPPSEPADAVDTAEARAFRKTTRQQAIHGLEVEGQILQILGNHPHIIRLKGHQDSGILLERMSNSSVARYLQASPSTSLAQRLKWALQAARGLAYIHKKTILHCDISVGNILLDQNLNVKLSDFQGRLLSSNGAIILDGGSLAGVVASSMPRPDPNHCDRKTDIFALGTAIYFMVRDGRHSQIWIQQTTKWKYKGDLRTWNFLTWIGSMPERSFENVGQESTTLVLRLFKTYRVLLRTAGRLRRFASLLRSFSAVVTGACQALESPSADEVRESR